MCKDVKERDPFWFYDVEHDDSEDFAHGDLDYEEDEFGFEEFVCVLGSECCMPGFHFRSECHTPEMAEEWHAGEEAYEEEQRTAEEVRSAQ